MSRVTLYGVYVGFLGALRVLAWFVGVGATIAFAFFGVPQAQAAYWLAWGAFLYAITDRWNK